MLILIYSASAYRNIFKINGLTFIVCVIYILFGIYCVFGMSDVKEVIQGQKWALILFGVIIFAIGGICLWGPPMRNSILLKMYIGISGIIATKSVIGGIIIWVILNGNILRSFLQIQMEHYKDGGVSKRLWDSIQNKLECCGLEYGKGEEQWELFSGTVPSSCCNSDLFLNLNAKCDYWQKGCIEELQNSDVRSFWILYWTFVVILVISIINSCFQLKSIKKEKGATNGIIHYRNFENPQGI